MTEPAASRGTVTSTALPLTVLPLTALTVAALALRALDLSKLQLWEDEAATWHFGRLTAAGRLMEQISLEPTPPLYYGLIGWIMKLFGESDLVMRWPSVIFGAALVPVVFFAGRELWSARAGWIAAVLVAVHPWHVAASREARVYPLFAVLTALAWWLLWRALEQGTLKNWAAVTVGVALACYSHLFGLFVGFAAGVAVLAWGRGLKGRLHGLAALALAGLLFVPYLVVTIPNLSQSGAAWSVVALYEILPDERNLLRPFELILVGADYHVFMREMAQPPTPSWIYGSSLLAQLVLIAAAIAAAMRLPERRSALLFLGAGWVVPILVPWIVNHFHVFFQTGRHELFVVGPAMLVIAAGADFLLENRHRRIPGALLLATLLLTTLLLTTVVVAAVHRHHSLLALPPTTGQKYTAAWVASRANPGDVVLAFGIRRLLAEHYLRLAGSDIRVVSFPPSTDSHPGWSDDQEHLRDRAALARIAAEQAAELGKEIPANGQLFVLARRYETVQAVDGTMLRALQAEGWQRVDFDEKETLIALRRDSRHQGSRHQSGESP